MREEYWKEKQGIESDGGKERDEGSDSEKNKEKEVEGYWLRKRERWLEADEGTEEKRDRDMRDECGKDKEWWRNREGGRERERDGLLIQLNCDAIVIIE